MMRPSCIKNFENLVKILDGAGVSYIILEHEEIPNVEKGLKIFACDPSEVVKTLGFFVKGNPLFFALRGDKKLDFKKVAALLRVNRKEISPIPSGEIEDRFHYEAGEISPLHVDSTIVVYFDENILKTERVFCGIGLRNRTLSVGSLDLFLLLLSILGDITQ